MDTDPDVDKKDVRRPMNAFLIFCKRHRSMVRERNSHLDNRSVTRILGDLWANIGEEEKIQYTDLAKQYKDAFMKANPDYKWHNPERMTQLPTTKLNRPTNERVPSVSTFLSEDGPIVPGKLADPSNMGGLSMLMEGIQVKTNQFAAYKEPDQSTKPVISSLIPTATTPVYPWIPQTDSDFGEEKKLVIDEQDIKEDNNAFIANSDALNQEHPSLMHDQDEKCPIDSDDALYSYGKVVMDHIIDKLYLSTIKNMGQKKQILPQTTASKTSPHPGTKEIIKAHSAMPLPPSQGKKSYHTSIAVKNLLEFTRRAAARDEANLKEVDSSVVKNMKQETDDKGVSETKQKLKDFCLKKEGRPKVISGNENSGDSFDVKEFKRKRYYSESCAELYRNQEKKMKLELEQCADERKSSSPSNGDDFQPTRKSRRRNRGQRYQELINEGIIQPSKARLAAMRTDTNIKNISFKETFINKKTDELGDEVLSVYPRQIRKRTMSESEKNRTTFDESSRYRTGDFDLEAQIKTLPACSLEKVVRPKRNVGKSSFSESDSWNTVIDGLPIETPEAFPEVKLTVPPHLKAKPSNSNVPVVGSRKRKARKHSIAHLLPVKSLLKPEADVTLSGIIKMQDGETKTGKECSPKCEIPTTGASSDGETIMSDKSDSIPEVKPGQSNIELGEIHKEIVDLSDIELGDIQKGIVDQSDIGKCVDAGHATNDNQTKFSSAENMKDVDCVRNHEMDMSCRNSVLIHENLLNSEHSGEDADIDEIRCNQKFTKLKEVCDLKTDSRDLKLCEENVMNDLQPGSSDACILKSDSCNNNHFKDQDENSNETDCCYYTNSNSSDICEENNVIGDNVKINYSDISGNGMDNVTMVTAVSVSVPMATGNICLSDNIEETKAENLQVDMESAVTQCDMTSSAVTMTTLQPSLTCLC